MNECVHEWINVTCCDGEHPALFCDICETLVDLVYEDDPRET